MGLFALSGHFRDGQAQNCGGRNPADFDGEIIRVILTHQNLQSGKLFFLGNEFQRAFTHDTFIGHGAAHGAAHGFSVEDQVMAAVHFKENTVVLADQIQFFAFGGTVKVEVELAVLHIHAEIHRHDVRETVLVVKSDPAHI